MGTVVMESYRDGERETLMADLASDLVERKESMQGNSSRAVRATGKTDAERIQAARHGPADRRGVEDIRLHRDDKALSKPSSARP